MCSFLQYVGNGGSEYPTRLTDTYIKGCSQLNKSLWIDIRALCFSWNIISVNIWYLYFIACPAIFFNYFTPKDHNRNIVIKCHCLSLF